MALDLRGTAGTGDVGPGSSRRFASGVGLVVIGVLSVQVGAGVATFLFPVAGAAGTVWIRLVLSAVIMAVLWPPSRLRWGWWRTEQGWSASAWLPVVGFGTVLAAMNWAFYESLTRIPLGVAVAVEFSGPLLLSVALSRRWLDLLWAAGAAAGLATLTFAGAGGAETPGGFDLGGSEALGIGFAAVAGLMWAMYILLSRRVGSEVAGSRGLAVALVVAAVMVSPAAFVAGSRLLDWRVLAFGAGVALLSTVIAYSVELEALRRVPARVFGILMSIEPAVAALIGLLLLGQVLSVGEWVGVAAICMASVGTAVTARRSVLE